MGVTQDIIHMFSSYNLWIWIGIFCAFSVLIAILSIGRWILEGKKNPLESIWMISMFALDEGNFLVSNRFLLIFSAFLSFYCFFLTQCLLSGISTEMIVIPDPIVVKSYRDLIEMENVSPTFMKGWPDYEDFMFAEEGSPERQVWQKGLKLEKKRNQSFLLDFNVEMIKYLRDAMAQRLVSITDSDIAVVGAGMVAKILADQSELGETKILLSPSGNKHSNVYALSPKLDETVFKSIHRKTRRFIETGFVKIILKLSHESVNPFSPYMSQFYSDRIMRHENDQRIEIRFENIQLTFCYLGYCYMIAFCTIITEIIRHKMKRPKRKVKRLFHRRNPMPRFT